MSENNFNNTLKACYIGYVVQSIMNNFTPLLFVLFNTTYGISFDKISILITLNFGIQLVVDLLSSQFVDKIGYRFSVVLAHVFSGTGLVLLAFLPEVIPNHYVGILISMIFMSVGGGLIEVVVSPIVEACPCEQKEAHMSLLHSFYCWGHVFVIIVSVAFFAIFGIENWKYLSLAFALVPIANSFYLMSVPIRSLNDGESTEKVPFRKLVREKTFWIMALMMLGAGASELGVSQWASAFAESGLGVSKTVGDLAGPMSFAILMGLSRVLYAKFEKKISLEVVMLVSGIMCFASYIIVSLSPYPAMSLVGCALCGFFVGIMWPGTYSLASKELKGGTAMFAILALAGDLGCSIGPSVVGVASGTFDNNLKLGILMTSVFPLLLVLGVVFSKRRKRNNKKQSADIKFVG